MVECVRRRSFKSLSEKKKDSERHPSDDDRNHLVGVL